MPLKPRTKGAPKVTTLKLAPRNFACPVSENAHRAGSIATQAEVDKQSESVVDVAADASGVGPARPVGHASTRPVIELHFDVLCIASPTGDDRDSAVRRSVPRIPRNASG